MPWEGSPAHVTVRRDGGKYRMWYGAWCGKSSDDQLLCYAESEDGFAWTRPELGLFEFQGSARNNICRRGPAAPRASTFVDPSAPPAERYKRIGNCTPCCPRTGSGYLPADCAASSHRERTRMELHLWVSDQKSRFGRHGYVRGATALQERFLCGRACYIRLGRSSSGRDRIAEKLRDGLRAQQ